MKEITIVIVIIIIAMIIIPGLYCGLTTKYYNIKSDSIFSSLKIALITDLHSCYYGRNMHILIDAINKESPDIILLGGDIFDDKFQNSNTETFFKSIVGRYPIYYVTGNHECLSGTKKFKEKMSLIDKYKIIRLKGDISELSIRDSQISLCGIDDPTIFKINKKNNYEYMSQLESISKKLNNKTYKILLAHRPELIEKYKQYDFDLVLCGHAHGGQWRIPGILNGVYAPNQGIFPKYAGGYYKIDNTNMIVSRGLARETTFIPRFYNPPELVIIKLHSNT